jgi:glucose/arabinose dehydrogenase
MGFLRAVLAVAGFVTSMSVAAPLAAAQTVPPGFTATRVASGIARGTAMALAPDGRIFVAEQAGSLRIIQDGRLLPGAFATAPVNSAGERGLLGIAFDADFAANQFVYVYYTAQVPALHNRIARYTANGDKAIPGSQIALLELDNLSGATNHNGGAIHFGPDGKLYAGVGENANGSNAQTLTNLLGKILRLNPDGSVPTDNPFFAQAAGKNRAIWAMGLRNPFTFDIQRGVGRIYINDVGQNIWEEIDRGVVGANYGWPMFEGPETNERFRPPVYAYRHDQGCAIAGAAFYDPILARFPPDYEGDYFFADLCGGWIRRLDRKTGVVDTFATGFSFPVDLQVSEDGFLYVLERGTGTVWKVDFTP